MESQWILDSNATASLPQGATTYLKWLSSIVAKIIDF
jgi:hypothetical protein